MALQDQIDIVIGPQAPIGTSYFDRTQVERGRFHADNFPAVPPANQNEYDLINYYDLAQNMYALYRRTGDPADLARAQKVADSWYASFYSKNGTTKNFFDGEGTTPKFAGIGGLICRALDGRPEMWDWINRYSRHSLNLWAIGRMNGTYADMQLREAAFSLHFAIWLAQLLPDSFPLVGGGTATNGAQLRAQYLADVEDLAVNYFGKTQYPDGSWRWDDWYSPGDDGSLLKGIMQPFMIGMLLWALCDLHELTKDAAVKENVKNQILKACRHIYSDGPYIKDGIATHFGKRVRGVHYFYHGGTELNPTRYAKGDFPFDTTVDWHVPSARQLLATILPAYGYAYKISGDPFFKAAGDEMWDSCYGGGDGLRAMMDGTAKNYNQHCRRVGSYLVWTGAAPAPIPVPTPTPTPTPSPLVPSPDGTKGIRIVDSEGKEWTIGPNKETLRAGTQMGGGQGTEYKYVSGAVYVLGDINQTTNRNWYRWSGGWSSVGPTEPGATPTPVPSPTPTPTPTPQPSPPPTPQPVTRILLWPSTESGQTALWQAQAKEGYRPDRHVPRPPNKPKGQYVEFVKF